MLGLLLDAAARFALSAASLENTGKIEPAAGLAIIDEQLAAVLCVGELGYLFFVPAGLEKC